MLGNFSYICMLVTWGKILMSDSGLMCCNTLLRKTLKYTFIIHTFNTVSNFSSFSKLVCYYAKLFFCNNSIFLGSSSQSLQIIEICLDGIENIQRVNSLSDVKTSVQEIQQFFVTKKSLGMLSSFYN